MPAIDTSYLVETPEGIDLQVDVAGPVPRALAYAIDFAIRSGIVLGASLILMFANKIGIGIMLILSFLLEWFYPVLFEVYRQGQTPGKKALGLVVVNDDLTPIALGTSLVRNLLRSADFLPFAYLFGLISMVLSGNFQRLGDIAAGTLVVYRSAPLSNGGLPPCVPIAPPISLALEDQIAIIDFTQRHQQLTLDRQRELAGILKEITRREADNGVEYLRNVGAWLLGMR